MENTYKCDLCYVTPEQLANRVEKIANKQESISNEDKETLLEVVRRLRIKPRIPFNSEEFSV